MQSLKQLLGTRRRGQHVAVLAGTVALLAAVASPAQAGTWQSFLNDTKSQGSPTGQTMRVVLADSLDVSSTVATSATVRVSGSARAYIPSGATPRSITLTDKFSFLGQRISSVTAAPGAWSITGGLTRKDLSYARTLNGVRNNGHVYNGLTVKGWLRSVEHRATGTTVFGAARVDVQAYDSCGVFQSCR
jgi:hypothetical protein